MTTAILVSLATLLPAQAAPAADAAKLKAAHDQAKLCAEAYIKGDFEALADSMMPELVEKMGGRQDTLKKLGQAAEEIKKAGVEHLSSTVSTPEAIHLSESDLYVIVPKTEVFKVKGQKFKLRSYLVGRSSDEGTTWKFIEGNPGEVQLRGMLPKLPKVMRFPNKEKPQRLPEK